MSEKTEICTKCKKEVIMTSDTKFCLYCGAPIKLTPDVYELVKRNLIKDSEQDEEVHMFSVVAFSDKEAERKLRELKYDPSIRTKEIQFEIINRGKIKDVIASLKTEIAEFQGEIGIRRKTIEEIQSQKVT